MITFVTDPYIIDPLGIAYLSAMLKQAKIETKLILSPEVEKEIIVTPIVAYSVTTGTHQHYMELNHYIRSQYHEIVSIFGGPHCTFYPEFAKEQGVDFIFRGECFEAVVEFAKHYNYRGLREDKDVQPYSTPNIAYGVYGTDKLVVNDLMPPIKVSTLPFPDRELIYQFPRNRDNPMKNMMCTFGCPLSCSYCYSKQYRDLGYPVRVRSVESVVEECRQLKANYPLEMIYFQDDIFPIKRKDWIEGFCSAYKTTVNLPFHIQIRIEMLDEDVLKNLVRAGLHGVTFAIETADIKIRKEVLNRSMSDEQIVRGVNLLQKHGVRYRIENMIGMPGETVETALDTLDMNISLLPDVGWASIYTPYYGTELGDYCRSEGLIDGDFEGDFFTASSLKLKNIKQIERLQKLFPLICAVPSLRPFVRLLTLLPFDYKRLYKTTKKYLYDNRLYALDKAVEVVYPPPRKEQ
ncbi:MAG: B12-binding domain-containing radical SAM protein [Planctomycetota bacterium]|jgi:radical SAM superfamily enzyme YgiQ (UPF0313 family)